jgi:hypothetical protein
MTDFLGGASLRFESVVWQSAHRLWIDTPGSSVRDRLGNLSSAHIAGSSPISEARSLLSRGVVCSGGGPCSAAWMHKPAPMEWPSESRSLHLPGSRLRNHRFLPVPIRFAWSPLAPHDTLRNRLQPLRIQLVLDFTDRLRHRLPITPRSQTESPVAQNRPRWRTLPACGLNRSMPYRSVWRQSDQNRQQ